MIRLFAALGLTSLCLAAPALASSDDAWAEFAAKVETKCLTAAAGMLEKPVIAVDPFGTESYGVAVLTGKPKGAKGSVSYLCVMDKKTETAEIGSELGADTLTVTIPAK